MEYEGMNAVVCDAEENDWLSVSYSERKYADAPAKTRTRKKIRLKFNKKIVAYAAVAVLCVALLATMLFIDGGFTKNVFSAVKAAYSTSVFEKTTPQPVTAQIALPCNVNLVEVSSDGVATFNGGRAVMSFTDGKVAEVTENSVTVAMDDDTCIVYQNLSEVYVNVNDVISANALLGKYDGNFTATISVSGQTVKEVIGSESQLTWNV